MENLVMKSPILLSMAFVTVLVARPWSYASAQVPPTKKEARKGTPTVPSGPTAPTTPSPVATTGGPGFKGVAELPDAVQIASNFSPDKQAATVIFRNLYSQVYGKSGSNIG